LSGTELPLEALPGLPYPLGATVRDGGCNFAVFAGGAQRLEVCLFDDSGRSELRRLALPESTDGVWHGFLPGVGEGQLYGLRAHGPYDPARGLRYNANKLLLDPYARALAGAVRWSDALYGYRLSSPRGDLAPDRRDSASVMTKGVVTVDRFDWGDDRPPRTPWSDTVIYEAHLRGLSMRHEAVPEHLRGRAGALGTPALIEHFRRLGITAIELLPIHALLNDRPLVEKNLSNYWGYNTLGFFAPEPRYLGDGGLDELKAAIRALHAAGIEVLLDVVYNHTCEGSELGPTLSLRGLDNLAYYRHAPEDLRRVVNYTGCGNTLNFMHPRVIQLTMDSLRYWVQAFRVDGFRFDLSVTLGREASGFDRGSGFFDALMQDPVLAQVKLIAEPWDIGPDGYQLGNHPGGMGEWNARFRDDVRRAWRGDAGTRGALAARLQGSADVFDHDGRRPWAAVNFVTAHDGFTLQDWVSYGQKHNEANGEDNRDGTDDNASNNWGAEGPSDDANVSMTRARVKRAALATLAFSHGTPMLLAGDEFGQTQRGNNNPYCQDSTLTWLDWTLAGQGDGLAQQAFLSRLLQLRRNHCTLRCNYFQHGCVEPLPQVRDIEWFDENGDVMRPEDWQYSQGRLLCVRRAARIDEVRAEVSLLLINTNSVAHVFQLPQPTFGWMLRLDSAADGLLEQTIDQPQLAVSPQSVQLLTAIVEAPSPAQALHPAGDSAVQPEQTVVRPRRGPVEA
jgi:glycogen operon protein